MALPRVAICGLGAMGGGMARHLLSQKFPVTGYDIHALAVEAFKAGGGDEAETPSKAVTEADILLLMVTTASQVTSVLFAPETGAIHALRDGAAIIVSSTVPSSFYEELRERIENEFGRKDIHVLDCPVSGGTPRAADGTLSIFASGSKDALDFAQPVLSTLSARLYKIPGGIGFGSKAKMCHQVMPEVDIALAAEVMALAARAGLNTQEVFDSVQASEGSSWIIGNRVPHMLQGDTKIYSAVTNSQKDSSIITTTGRSVGFPVFLVAGAEQVYTACVNRGWGADDDSSIPRLFLHGLADDIIFQQTRSPGPIARNDSITIQTIIDIFAGVHLALASEAMAFTEAVGLDTQVMYDIISQAAGSNTMFVRYVPKMVKPAWSLREVGDARCVGQKLATALGKANAMGASMPMASAALQMYHLHLGVL